MPTSPRHVALNILAQWRRLADPPLIPERGDPAWSHMAPRDRSLCFELIAGILRRRLTLDAIIASRLDSPLNSLDPKIHAALWIGAYQLLFHEGVPTYAIVHATVDLARRAGRPRATGLVNAILRSFMRLKPTLEVRYGLSVTTFPRDFGHHIRLLEPVFPHPALDLYAHLAAVTSHPRELVDRLIAALGEQDATNVMIRNNLRPAILLRADDADFTPPPDAALIRHEMPDFWAASGGWNRALERCISRGELSPQDPTASRPVRALVTLLTETKKAGGATSPHILDLCAGLGTKTMQLARELPAAQVIATDLDPRKLERLSERADQLQLNNVRVVPLPDVLKNRASLPPFGAVLADVPCSNTGVMARRPQSRWRWPQLDQQALGQLQTQLLSQAVQLAAVDGIIVYSTCAIDPAENHDRIGDFMANIQPGRHVILYQEHTTLPSTTESPVEQHDGGYFAILIKKN